MCVCVCVCVCVYVCAQLCPTFCDPMDCSLPGFSVHGISQARILEWVAISFSRGSSWPRDWTCMSWVLSLGRWILYHCATWESWFNIHQVKGEMATHCENSNPAIRNKWKWLVKAATTDVHLVGREPRCVYTTCLLFLSVHYHSLLQLLLLPAPWPYQGD